MSTGVARVLVLHCFGLVQFGLVYLGSMLILNKTEELEVVSGAFECFVFSQLIPRSRNVLSMFFMSLHVQIAVIPQLYKYITKIRKEKDGNIHLFSLTLPHLLKMYFSIFSEKNKHPSEVLWAMIM